MNDTILRTQNYYTGIDPGHYYKTSSGTVLDGKATRAKKHKDVYLSDLLNNASCSVSFGVFRDRDDVNAPKKISSWGDIKSGTVVSYNPETNLLAVECSKKRPSRLSRLFKRTNKIRYVEPDSIKVSSISRFCLLRRANISRSASSPKGASTPKDSSSPKGMSRSRSASSPKGVSTPKASFRATPRGGSMRITRKNRQTGK